MADFTVADRVSVGLHGRSDEMIFEATVRDPSSELYGSTVVLRQLTSSQAKRRGRRALEVLKKLARRQMMYHSYAMQVHGYVTPSKAMEEGDSPLVLVHGYHGSYSLRHWLQLSDWLPTLEATLALDEEQVNYLHSHGMAHTELRLENVHVSPVDKHVKVGILGNAVDFHDNDPSNSAVASNNERRKMMIAFDMRCVGFIMAKMVLRELMDSSTFQKFKSFLNKGNDPSCLREFLVPILSQNSPSGNIGLQMLDRHWGAGWNLLALLLATKSDKRISCVDALRHPFLCGPKWRISPTVNVVRWGLGSTAVRLAEDYIYGHHQRRRLAYFIELMEVLNPNSSTENWLRLLPGRWCLLYCTGRHIGLTLRQPTPRVLINDAFLTFAEAPESVDPILSLTSDIGFKIMPESDWPHDKSGTEGNLSVTTSARITPGRIYTNAEDGKESSSRITSSRYLGGKWGKAAKMKELPASLPTASVNVDEDDVDVSMSCGSTLNVKSARNVLQEVRTQTPPEMFDLSKIVCGTYIDSRLMVLRGVNGSALLFVRSNPKRYNKISWRLPLLQQGWPDSSKGGAMMASTAAGANGAGAGNWVGGGLDEPELHGDDRAATRFRGNEARVMSRGSGTTIPRVRLLELGLQPPVDLARRGRKERNSRSKKEAETKGVRIGRGEGGKGTAADPQAMGKVLAEKPVYVEGMIKSLGRAWCPLKGIKCKDLGENVFLFTFLHASGKRKVPGNVPWMVGKDLIVLEDFDPLKTIEEYEFKYIPTWARVMKMPLGLMNEENGESIGNQIGDTLEVEIGEDDSAIGSFLRVKVKLDISMPLLRGVTLDIKREKEKARGTYIEMEVDKDKKKRDDQKLCPLEYEYLPDFCYTCRIIGHVDKLCSTKLARGEI
ncbi:unnamed protein product [Triticum turgidum subsp. durum]|uniref:Protein kinase domain-containing protein n=1 Tax=Triticum turgidum subsp. durum TaxID=4567 RepID=A0A9R0RLJ7_TRITD|nr:unnamed protein product [Triticum turgidum subsp. durum]